MKTARSIALAAALFAFAPLLAHAASPRADVNDALDTVFKGIDRNGNGILEPSEVSQFTDKVFAAMDRNHDGRLTRTEFRGLSLGLEHLAERHGRMRTYTATRDRIFQRWSEHGHGHTTMSRASLGRGLRTELSRAAGPTHALTLDRFKRAQFIEELAAASH